MTEQPQKRKRGPGRPVLENLRNAGPRLREGERSQLHRIRAPGDVQDWIASLTAEQRGELLALARQLGLGHEHPPREWPEGVREHMEALEARFPRDGSPSRQRVRPQGPDSVSVLHVVSTEIPKALKNRKRWRPERYEQLEARLREGERLVLDRVNGKRIWRTATGASIRRDTVAMLYEAGVLAVG